LYWWGDLNDCANTTLWFGFYSLFLFGVVLGLLVFDVAVFLDFLFFFFVVFVVVYLCFFFCCFFVVWAILFVLFVFFFFFWGGVGVGRMCVAGRGYGGGGGPNGGGGADVLAGVFLFFC